jgi:hypothetical protein
VPVFVAPVLLVLDGRWRWVGRLVGFVAVVAAIAEPNAISIGVSGSAYLVRAVGVAAWTVVLGWDAWRVDPGAAPGDVAGPAGHRRVGALAGGLTVASG